jgi:NAD(P)-dependent dehydrogenase (short-subunit alcohol dehydrogenase family)
MRLRPVTLALSAAALITAGLLSRRRRYDLHGKTVLVTGGARGLGLVLARTFGARGARVVICARDAATLEIARRDLEARGIEALDVACDVRDEDQVLRLIAAAHARFGRIDVLVNAAGVIDVGPFETMGEVEIERAIGTHVLGPLATIRAVLPEMRARREGRIVNVSSIGGLVPIPHLAPYCAGKHALVGLSRALGTELAADGVVVTTVCPGLVRTGSPRNVRFLGDAEGEYAWFRLGDDAPLTSMRAERVARRIVAATVRGERFVVVGLQAKLAALASALAPNLVDRIAGLVARALPGAPRSSAPSAAKYGFELDPIGPFVELGDAAAVRNNELPWRPQT